MLQKCLWHAVLYCRTYGLAAFCGLGWWVAPPWGDRHGRQAPGSVPGSLGAANRQDRRTVEYAFIA